MPPLQTGEREVQQSVRNTKKSGQGDSLRKPTQARFDPQEILIKPAICCGAMDSRDMICPQPENGQKHENRETLVSQHSQLHPSERPCGSVVGQTAFRSGLKETVPAAFPGNTTHRSGETSDKPRQKRAITNNANKLQKRLISHEIRRFWWGEVDSNYKIAYILTFYVQ